VKNIYYNIHELVRIKISSLSWHLIKDLNCLYSYFEKKEDEDPDLFVEINDFVPDLNDCFSLDHKYFIRRNFIFLEDYDKGLKWKMQIEGLEERQLKVKFFAPKSVYSKFPWMFFPDLILHLYVLQPLVEMLLFRKGWMVIHAGAVHQNGKAYLIAGRGESHKTDCVIELMRRGYDYISDDMVILNGNEVLSFPHSISFFDFRYRYLGREEMNLWEKIRLFVFLRRHHPFPFKIADHSSLGSITFVILTNKRSIDVKNDLDIEEMLKMLFFNQVMERTSYVSHKTIIGKFLEAYRFIFPEFKFFPSQREWIELFIGNLKGIPFRVLEIPLKWESHFVEKLLIE
jgi:hypothetical protein